MNFTSAKYSSKSRSSSSSKYERKFPTILNFISTTTLFIVILLLSPSSRSNNAAWWRRTIRFATTTTGGDGSRSIFEVEACPFLLKQMMISDNAAEDDGDGDSDGGDNDNDHDRRLSEMQEWIQQERLKHRRERQV